MQLLRIDCLGYELRLEGSMAGTQELFWNNQMVSQLEEDPGSNKESVHEFSLSDESQDREQPAFICQLTTDLNWQPFKLNYELKINGEVVNRSLLSEKDIETQVVDRTEQPPRKIGFAGLFSLGFKLLKSAKVVKVLFAAGSLAAYTWLFSLPFAMALILCLVFHEYGHIKAMQYFGMKTKGIYLIPFVGGLALSDEKINTRWQDVVISLMGPFFGLTLSLGALVGYWLTGIEILGGIAAFNALLNLFNLLPVLPLDGGHVLKSITFSVNSAVGLVACVLGAAFGVYLSYSFGLALLGFLLAVGTIEILMEWKGRHQSQLLPLDRKSQMFSTLWYSLTVGGLCAVIYVMGQSSNQALGLPLKILGS